MCNTITEYDTRHGGPYDRGGADFYYWRPYQPHYFIGGTHTSPMVDESDMTQEQIAAYEAGWLEAQRMGDRKDWGD